MSIYKGSRYESSKYTIIKFNDGTTKKFIHGHNALKQSDFKRALKVTQPLGSTEIDILALKFSNDENRWWVIADINNILFPFDTGGRELLIPDRKEFKAVKTV